MPLPQEVGNPCRIVQMVGEPPKGVPFLAVDKIYPGGGFAVPVGHKVVLRFLHVNDQNAVDSLQRKALSSVMSVTQFSHYEPAGKAP